MRMCHIEYSLLYLYIPYAEPLHIMNIIPEFQVDTIT